MRFLDHLDHAPAPSRRKVHERLRALEDSPGPNPRMIENLLAEERFDPNDCKAIQRALCCSKLEESGKFGAFIRQMCRKNRKSASRSPRCLSGERAKVDLETDCIRVVRMRRLAQILRDHYFHESVDEALAFIDGALGESLPSFLAVWKSRPLGKYQMWSSIRYGDDDASLLGIPLRELLCWLGIDAQKGPYVLMDFRLPPYVTPRVPTFWDAYASGVWPSRFRVAARGAEYGLTDPPDGCPRESRPEIVHALILPEALLRVPRYVV